MAVEESMLTTRRGVIKGRIKRFLNFLNNFPQDGDLLQIQVRKNKIDDDWDEFQKIQSTIEANITDEASITATENYRIEFEDLYFHVIAAAERLLSRAIQDVNESRRSEESVNVTGNNRNPSSAGGSHQASIVKLAALNVPEFSGSYREWSTFNDMFTALIHTNEALTDVQKFFYLKSSLAGEAAKVIQCFETSAKNYRIAWDCLNERYNNKRIMVQAHTKAIFDLEIITEESAEKLRQFVDKLFGHIKALEAIGYDPMNWGPMLLHIISIKLDGATLREWESRAPKTEVPKIDELIQFLRDRFQILESIESAQNINKADKQVRAMTLEKREKGADTWKKRTAVMHAATVKFKCYVCEEPHAIYRCAKFLALAIKDRQKRVTELELCNNCLTKHAKGKCKSRGCKICEKRHNTLLHLSTPDHEHNAVSTSSTSINALAANNVPGINVLLSTAIIKIYSSSNETLFARALLDSASQSSFITNDLVSKLRLSKRKIDCAISGVNSAECRVSYAVSTKVQARNNSYEKLVEFMTLPKITAKLPAEQINVNKWSMSEPNELADPSYAKPGKIDVLLGADVFFDSLLPGKYKPELNGPIYQKTAFGWVVAGLVAKSPDSIFTFSTQTILGECCRLEEQMSKFWRLEELKKEECHSLEEKSCVAHFEKTVTRNADGKFVIQLPFKENVEELGVSRPIALKRFISIENKFRTNSKLKNDYIEFIDEYQNLGHMEQIRDNKLSSDKPIYYIPHHAVLRGNSLTTKLRVVFDASCATESGPSLNDILLKGPTIQDDLMCIVVRFRTHKYVMSADIEKMYRQIWVAEKDRDFQRILWRTNPEEVVKEFRLNTVTYGMGPASYLATACLKKLADEYRSRYPVACDAIAQDFYMDDYLGGASTIEQAIELRNEIITILSAAGFHLRKWVSNNTQITTGIPNINNDPLQVLNIGVSAIKTLGLFWMPGDDTYQYKFEKINDVKTITKRIVLSTIATIFDPLSLIGPVVVKAKIIMQRLWKINIGWDEKLPPEIHEEWNNYYAELSEIKEIRIPRCIIGVDNCSNVQLHGFADASEKAYGATIYLRATDNNGNHVVRLIASKSRVSPLKVISLAKLELCAALLLVRLSKKIISSLKIKINQRYFWSDSTIVLAWLNSPSSKWKTFVAHRVGEIHEFSAASEWAHVKSGDNPADILSRGSSPAQLRQNQLWWEGPKWLQVDEHTWPNDSERGPLSTEEIPESKKERVIVLNTRINCHMIENYSSLEKALRITAYCMRWKNYKKNKRFSEEIELEEIESAKSKLIKLVQQEYFGEEIKCLTEGKNISKQSKLKLLNPFLDENGQIRVGGRLNNSEIANSDKKNPIILHARSKLTKLIFIHEHNRLLHVGPQALLASIRERYWPLNGRNLARSIVNKCIICFKTRPFTFKPIMGNLPKARVEPGRAFAITGVDFAGPITIKSGSRRNAPTLKAYICVFVCFATKAVHVELVSDLSTDAFLAALRRFWSRRGYCQTIWSDNGKNFVGADRKLKELRDLFMSKEHQKKVNNCLNEVGVKWHFIPVYSPHYGGLWESSVKAVKFHLVRHLGDALLTFEELYTVLNRIEACLNSRPLTPLSTDPSDLNVLTPGHFLVGGSLTCLPEKDVSTVPINRLRRWQRVTHITQQIWKRWSKEYLSQLQTRSKWFSTEGPLVKRDMMVIVKEPNTPTMHWRLARVVDLHPGLDGIVRVVTIRTEKGISKQIVRNLCPLPISD